MSTDEKLDPRYPDEAWTVSIDWTDDLLGETIDGAVTAVAIPEDSFTVGPVNQVNNVTYVKISGGTARNMSARLAMLAPTSGGNALGFNLGAPIRTR